MASGWRPDAASPAARNTATGRLPITRRGALLLGVQGAVAGALAWRLHDLQIARHEHYRLLAEENRINVQLIAPARGQIFDRNGQPLAVNTQNFRILLIREQADDAEEVLDRLARLIEIPEYDRVLNEIRHNPPFVPVVVAEHLSWDEFARVNVNAPTLPGIRPDVGLSRHYPDGPATAHVVGYVGRVTQSDIERMERVAPVLMLPGFRIGQTGIERTRDKVLRGAPGTRQLEVNALGRVMRELDRHEAEPGDNLHLTLDIALQEYCLRRLGKESAAAVLMDVQTGDILSAASSPSYDPNLFVLGISQKAYGGLLHDDHRPLFNKWASGTYPPGSTFKPVVALAALGAGIEPDERVYCPGYLEVGNRYFHCWRGGGHGWMNMTEAIEQSCDVFFYEMARKIGIARIADMAHRMGMGMQNDLPIPSISSGLIPTKAWKRNHRGADWQVGDTLNAGIGQGYVLATPLQLAIMASRAASGSGVQPRIIRARAGLPRAPAPPIVTGVDPQHFELVRRGMRAVVNGAHGTAHGARIEDPFWLMAGKSGTSQVRSISNAERARGLPDEIPWKYRTHALFIAYAPADAPRYATAVVVAHGGGGSSVAAPIARDILLAARDRLRPTAGNVPQPVAKPVERA